MRSYFEKMPRLGRALTDRQIAEAAENIEAIHGVESALDAAVAARASVTACPSPDLRP